VVEMLVVTPAYITTKEGGKVSEKQDAGVPNGYDRRIAPAHPCAHDVPTSL